MVVRGRYSPKGIITEVGTIATGVWEGTDVGVSHGGTGASTAAAARTNLGLVLGTDVQAYDAGLLSLAGLEPLGSEELADFDFDSAAEWTGTDWTIDDGSALKWAGTGEDTLSEDANPFTVKSGVRYKVVLVIQTADSLSVVRIDLGGDSSATFITAGTETFYLDTINTNALAIVGNVGAAGGGLYLGSISIKEAYVNTYIKITDKDTYDFRIPSEARTDLGLGTIATYAGDQNLQEADSPAFTKVNYGDTNTHITKDGSGNLALTDVNAGTLTLIELACPPLVKVSDSTVAEGNNSITSFENKVLIKWLNINTTSTNWLLTLYSKDDYSTKPFQVAVGKNGDFDIYLDYPYEDEDATSELHYTFTSGSGSETHDIEVRGYKLR